MTVEDETPARLRLPDVEIGCKGAESSIPIDDGRKRGMGEAGEGERDDNGDEDESVD